MECTVCKLSEDCMVHFECVCVTLIAAMFTRVSLYPVGGCLTCTALFTREVDSFWYTLQESVSFKMHEWASQSPIYLLSIFLFFMVQNQSYFYRTVGSLTFSTMLSLLRWWWRWEGKRKSRARHRRESNDGIVSCARGVCCTEDG